LEAIMRISEAFAKMRLSEYCSSQDIDRAIAVAVDSFIGSQKVSAKKALARAFAKYTLNRPGAVRGPARANAGAGGRAARVNA
jgi:DNA replication licensing factor MCM2